MFPNRDNGNGNGHIPDDAAAPALANAPPAFTAREQEIVPLIGRGLSNREIAMQLNISYLTVKVHMRHIYARMGVTHRAAAVAWITQHWNPDGRNSNSANSDWQIANHVILKRCEG